MSDETYYKVGGSLEYQHPTYVVRKADSDLIEGLKKGEFCYVLNSRQMGKSSLRVQMMKKLKEQGVKCASIDMTRIGSHVTPAEWYAGVVSELLRGFGLSRKVNFSSWWRDRELLPPLQRLRELIEDVLLAEFSQNLVIFIDEIDSIIKIKFKEDFFAFIRACYNQRVDNPEYNRLTFCLLGVATPSDLIADKNISTPFNIGRAIELTGFGLHEVQPLVQGLEGRVSNPEVVLREVLEWTGGQPFLTQKLCKLILSWEKSIPEGKEAECVEELVRSRLTENWETQDEPEHLRTIRDRILWSDRKEQLLRLYQQILQTGEIKANDKPEHMELRLSGLVVKQQGKLRVYNRIYGSVFNQSWVENALAEAGLLPEVAETSAPKAEIQALEQAGVKALKLFEYQQIEALLLAIQAGQALKALITDGRPIQDYPTISPLLVLQTILNNIRERNQFNSYQGKSYIHDVCFSPDGQQIVTAEDDGTIQLWQLSGQQIFRWKGHLGAVRSVSFSPDGRYLATAGRDGKARLWNLSGQQLTEFGDHQGWGLSVSFSPDGQQLVTAGAGKARLWNLLGQQIARFDGYRGSVWSVSFSPDGQQVATAGMDGKIRLWNLSGQQIAEFEPHQSEAWSVSFSPDGQLLGTAGNDNTARLWNLSGQLLTELNGHQGMVRNVSFSPDGQQIATAGYDGTARLWNLSGQQLAQLNGHQAPVLSVSFSPEGQLLVTAGADGTARLWDLSEKPLVQWNSYHPRIRSVSFSPNGQRVATAGPDGSIRLWNLEGKQLSQFNGHEGRVRSVSFSPDGKHLATAGAEGTARLWNLEVEEQQIVLKGHQGRVNSVSFSPDGKHLATAGDDGTVRFWNLEGKLLSQLNAHQGRVYDLSFSPDGQRFATAEEDGTARLWQMSGQQLLELKGQRGRVYSLSFSPDGQYLAIGGTGGTIRLWDLSGRQLAQWQSHQGTIYCISFNPNGQQIATAGADGMAKLWDLSGRQLAQWQSPSNSVYRSAYRIVGFSPDGQRLATVGTGGLQIWRIGGLDELLSRGCDWLKDYLITHPQELEKLEVCQNRFKSIEAGRNLAEAGDVEGAVFSEAMPLAQRDEVQEIANLRKYVPRSYASRNYVGVVPDNLSSECGMDYTRLRSRLAAGRWEEADQETTALMLRISGREAEGWLREQDIEKFPCIDLLTIDQLWVKYSKRRFGFSVQMEIWQSVGGTENADYKIYRTFSNRIEWGNGAGSWWYSCGLIFSLAAPVGHLPGGLLDWLWSSYRESRLKLLSECADDAAFCGWWNIISSIASRLALCNLQYPSPTTVARRRLVTTASDRVGQGFLGEFLVNDKLVRIYQGDITNLVTDVIVSSDDNYLTMSGGVSYRIRQVGSDEIYREARNLTPLSLGEVAVTTAGKLRAKKIFHAVVIDFEDREGPSEEVIRRVVHTCMKKANIYGFTSIAFPLLGTGSGAFPVKYVWENLLGQIIRDLSNKNQKLIEVIIVLYKTTVIEELKIKDFLETIEELGWKSLM